MVPTNTLILTMWESQEIIEEITETIHDYVTILTKENKKIFICIENKSTNRTVVEIPVINLQSKIYCNALRLDIE